MRKLLSILVLAGAAFTIVGCASTTTIPQKLEVKDVTTGKTYTTYKPWGDIDKGVGLKFTDIQTGDRVTLTSYEIKTLDSEKTVPSDSPEAKAYDAVKAKKTE